MKVLVACEESQEVCKAFRAIGHAAYSCDLKECSGGRPEWHLLGDALVAMRMESWDLIIAHPPCTYLTVSGNRWFNMDKYPDAPQRYRDRIDAIQFFMKFALNSDCPHIAIENPIGIMSSVYRKPDQIIQPYQFGDPFEKQTCLWLKDLPALKATDIVTPPPRVKYGKGKSMQSWIMDAWSLPKEERQTIRSKTFPGIARAMADQWTEYIMGV